MVKVFFIVKTLFQLALVMSLIASPIQAAASIVPVDPCYSPLEMAALFSHGKKKKASLDDRIKEKEKQIEQKEKLLERLEDGGDSEYSKGISDFIDELGNSLDKNQVLGKPPTAGFCDYTDSSGCPPADNSTVKDSKGKVASHLAGYIDLKENGWDCEQCGAAEEGANCPCREWQKDEDTPYFKSNGKIDNGFCTDYATDVSTCKSSLRKLKSAYKKKAIFERQIEKLQAEIEELYMQQEEEEITGESDEDEGSGICLDCLEELRDMNKPGWGEIAGNTLMTGLGVGLSVFGIRAARRAQNRANDLLALQGFPAENNFGYSLAGASLGLPFIQRGIYGLTQGNAAAGGYGCSHTANPYAMHNPMMQHQMMQQQYQMQAMGYPFGGYGSPFQMQMQGNPLAGLFGNPFGGYGSPFQMQMQGNPLAGLFGGVPYGGFGGGSPFQLQMQGNPLAGLFGNPFGGYGSPFQMQMQGNPFGGLGNPYFGGGMNPMMGVPGMNPMFMNTQAQYAMQQMQSQMQMRQAFMKAYMDQQQSIQQDWMQRQQVIGSLTQELYKIQSQIQMVASGGAGAFGATTGSIGSIPGIPGGTTPGAPQPSPSTSPGGSGGSGELPTVISR